MIEIEEEEYDPHVVDELGFVFWAAEGRKTWHSTGRHW